MPGTTTAPLGRTGLATLAEKHLGDISGLRVLEIGCGRGEFTRLLAERGAVVTGMDVSEYAVSRAAALVAEFPNADARVGDIWTSRFLTARSTWSCGSRRSSIPPPSGRR